MDTHDFGTDLLRTLVVVVEERSYTRAAARLNLSQPTVSAHIRRLQQQLGYDIFDKSVPGVKLTPNGEFALIRARQILALHESLLRGAESVPSTDQIRIGIPNEIRWDLSPVLAKLHADYPTIHFRIERGQSSELLEKYRGGGLDLCAATQLSEISGEAYIRWRETLIWVGAPKARNPGEPIDIVAPPDGCLCRSVMMNALESSNTAFRITVDTNSVMEAFSAAAAGLGYLALLRSNVPTAIAEPGPDAGLPVLSQYYHWGIFLNANNKSLAARKLAEMIAANMSRAESYTLAS